MAYSILIAGQIAANHSDSLNKTAKCETALENANLIRLTSISSTSGEDEVYVASSPVSGSLDTDVFYMVNNPVNVLVSSKYAGLTDDPREYNIAASTIFACYKPMVGDEIAVSEDGFATERVSETHAIPAIGSVELNWSDTITDVSLAYQYMDSYNIPVGSTRVTGYKLLCVKG